MDKYIGFDIDSKKTVACAVQKGQKERFTTLKTDVELMKKFLQKQHNPGIVLVDLAVMIELIVIFTASNFNPSNHFRCLNIWFVRPVTHVINHLLFAG